MALKCPSHLSKPGSETRIQVELLIVHGSQLMTPIRYQSDDLGTAGEIILRLKEASMKNVKTAIVYKRI